jgi:hypothetical protein
MLKQEEAEAKIKMNLNRTLTIHPQTKANKGNIRISKATQVFQSGQHKKQ